MQRSNDTLYGRDRAVVKVDKPRSTQFSSLARYLDTIPTLQRNHVQKYLCD